MTNLASTMVTLLASCPALAATDVSRLRLLSCGGSPLPPATVAAAIAAFGCEFFVSYGMTECCGKIAMSLLPADAAALPPAEQLALICTSGRSVTILETITCMPQVRVHQHTKQAVLVWRRRPFKLLEVRVVAEDDSDVGAGSQQIGEVWCR